MNRPKVKQGDRLWFKPSTNTEKPRYVTVIKVGRSYFYTDNHKQWAIANWTDTANSYLRSKLYASEEEWQAERNLEIAWNNLQRAIAKPYKSPLTIEQIEQIQEWLKS